MNKYGRMAIRHWEKTDPDRFQQIPESDRETFFTELGERAEMEIQQLQDQLAGPDPAGESYLEKVGRLNMARLQAEAMRLLDEELATAKDLEAECLLFLVGLTAVVTPKGRRFLAQHETKPKPGKPPLGFLD